MGACGGVCVSDVSVVMHRRRRSSVASGHGGWSQPLGTQSVRHLVERDV